jgi:hypothetical protein
MSDASASIGGSVASLCRLTGQMAQMLEKIALVRVRSVPEVWKLESSFDCLKVDAWRFY